jgi:pyroglutamyl-peptidase
MGRAKLPLCPFSQIALLLRPSFLMKTILLTGFEPFGGHASNPSDLIAKQLDGRMIAGRRVIGATLACEFGKSIRQVRTLLARHGPELVICLGLAENRSEITPERIAINEEDARIPDNAGRQPIGRPVMRGGPVGYWSTLPIKSIVAALRANGLPASVSNTAGTFVCNHVFYGLMHELSQRSRRTRGGFIHVPPAARKVGSRAGLTLDQLTSGMALAIETSLLKQRDNRAPK